jgi:WD40 repeat protein
MWPLGESEKRYKHADRRGILRMELSPDGKRFATFEKLSAGFHGRGEKTISVWDVPSGHYRTLPKGINYLAGFTPDGASLVAGARSSQGMDRVLKLFDPETLREKLAIPIPDKQAAVHITGFSPGSHLMVGDYRVFASTKDADLWQVWLKGWDLKSGREMFSFGPDKSDGFPLTEFTRNGKTLAVLKPDGNPRKLVLYRVAGMSIAKSIELGPVGTGQNVLTSDLAMSADGKWLAVALQQIPRNLASAKTGSELSQPRIFLIDLAAGAVRETFVSPPAITRSLSFSPDGTMLASGGHGRVLLWDLRGLR